MSNFDYTQVNGIFYSNLVLPCTDYKIGTWGERYRTYIKTHRRRFIPRSKCSVN